MAKAAQPVLFISAGEVSGDLYASAVLKQLRLFLPQLQAYGLGGPYLKEEGLQILADLREHAAVGLTENADKLFKYRPLLQRLKRWLQQVRPQLVLLVDFQGFNLQLAAIARELGIPVYYYLAPQDWIWGFESGTRRVIESCDLILSVFKPEARFYRERGAEVLTVGHPILDLVPPVSRSPYAHQQARLNSRQELGLELDPEQTLICWMPGSRQSEWDQLLPVMQEIQAALPFPAEGVCPIAADFLVAPERLKALNARRLPVWQRYKAMLASDLIIAASGSAILEAALLGRPVIALYRVSGLTYQLARTVLKKPWVTLPNLLLDEAVVPEFIQHFSIPDIVDTIEKALADPLPWQTLPNRLWGELGPGGGVLRAAEALHLQLSKGKLR